MKQFRRILIVCALAIAGCSKPAEPEHTPPAPVKVAAAESVELDEWTDLIGATQPLPDKAAHITVTIPGRVTRVLQDAKGKPLAEGQVVDKGDVVAQLDDRAATAQREKTLAMIEELLETKKQADLARQLAQLDLDRLQKLYPAGADPASIPLVSKIEIDKARLALQESESKQKGAVAKEKALREDVKLLAVQLDYHQLRSPIKGVLGAIKISPGQTLSAGTTVAEVVDLGALDVVAYASPHATARLKVGATARLLADDRAEVDKDTPTGTITYIALQAQADTGNFLVKARFANKDLRYRANQVVRLDVQLQASKKRLVLAQSALMEDHDPPYVVIVQDKQTKKNKDGKEEDLGKARRVLAHIGVRDRTHQKVEILRLEDPEKKDALPLEGTLFIIEGGHGLHNGDEVKIGK